MNLHQVVLKLIGRINPVGETNEDNERFENLKEMTNLVEQLLSDIRRVSSYKDSGQYSVQRSGEYADNFLKDLSEE